jgi:hypothetical protein
MKIKRLPAGFVVPAQPMMGLNAANRRRMGSRLKHDGYRLIVGRDGLTRLYTRNGGVGGGDGRLGKPSPKRVPAGVGEPRFKAFGERPRQSRTTG